MKEEFLDELEKELNEAGVSNVKEVVDLYEKRFALGLEAGLSEEEILEMLDDIQTIVKSYTPQKEQSSEEEQYELTLDLRYFSDFDIISTVGSEIRFEIDEKALEFVKVHKENRKIQLKSINKEIVFKKKKRLDGTLYIGQDLEFSKFIIENIGCDVSMEDMTIRCEKLEISNVSGDLDLARFDVASSAKFHNTTGDITLDSVVSPYLELSTVSGDFDIEEIVCDEGKISSISGDIHINKCNNAKLKMNTISGDVKIVSGEKDLILEGTSISGTIQIDGESVGSDLGSIIREGISKIKF